MHLVRLANPDYMYLLLLLPVMVVLYIINEMRKRRNRKRLGDPRLISNLIPELSDSRSFIKFILLLSAVLVGVIMLARLQFGSKIEDVKKQGVEVIIALDVSNSMLSEDIQPDRLTRAKQAISRLVDNLDNDKIGLIVFAGDAYTQIPVTTDYISAKMFLSTISPEMVPKQGTSIGAAISLGIRSFTPGDGKSKAMIIITDGENHEDDPVKAAEEAAQAGIVIHTIGIGSTDGVPVPVTLNGKKDYLKDVQGNTVISKLDEDILKKIAMSANGSYVRASNTNIGLDQIFGDIKKMKTQELETTQYTEHDDMFQYAAGLMLILIIIEFIIMDRKNRRLADTRLFKVKV
jgi:Ca-activated chloride channel homolog